LKFDASIAPVVAGGGSDLGDATARARAAEGVKVALFDLNQTKGEATGGVFCRVDGAIRMGLR
jgi:NAD(P)-dependent dehydrogenase (short-subunit alcohol dehydrogenase family)